MRRHGVDFKPFDVVVVPFPFTDKLAEKRRPALIVSGKVFNEQHDQLLLAMITTAKSSEWSSDIQLRDLENTDIPIIISLYCNVKTGELAYEDICTEPQRHNS